MRKPIVWTLAALALIGVLVAGLVVGIHRLSSSSATTTGAECTVPLTAGSGAARQTAAPADSTSPVAPIPVYLSAVQLQHASTINGVGMARGLPGRARTIAIATAFQESGLRNLPGGDRDSVGLFQQRPSQGWGTRTKILDPVYAAGRFYDALRKVPGWQQMSLTAAAQAVQYSGFPQAYAKWEGQSTTLSAALGGAGPVAVTCAAGALAPTADAPPRRALAGTSAAPPALSTVLAAAAAELGGIRVASITGATATLTVTVPGIGADQAGRALAAWAVAHSTGFAVTKVAVDDQRWTEHSWGASQVAESAGRVSITTG